MDEPSGSAFFSSRVGEGGLCNSREKRKFKRRKEEQTPARPPLGDKYLKWKEGTGRGCRRRSLPSFIPGLLFKGRRTKRLSPSTCHWRQENHYSRISLIEPPCDSSYLKQQYRTPATNVCQCFGPIGTQKTIKVHAASLKSMTGFYSSFTFGIECAGFVRPPVFYYGQLI